MKVLFLSNNYPPFEIGGYEQLCRDVAVRLAQRGHAYAVLTSDRGAGDPAVQYEESIYRDLRISPDYSSNTPLLNQFLIQRRRIEAENIRVLKRVVERERPDVISIWNTEGLSNSLSVAAEAFPNTGVAYWIASSSPAGRDRWWHYWKETPHSRWYLAGPKIVLAELMLGILRAEGKPERPAMQHTGVVSAYMREQGIAQGDLPRTAQVIYNGVELDAFERPVASRRDAPLRFLIAGRVSEDKGVHLAIEALGQLQQTGQLADARLVIAGGGLDQYMTRLRDLAVQFDVKDQVDFTGWLPREQVPAMMADCDVLLLPTIHQEPFARVVLEALASGLAVIAADTGGTTEIIRHDVTGLVFRPGDSAALAAQMHRLIAEPELRRRIAAAGQAEVLANFSLENMVDNIERLLQEAVLEARSRAQ